MEFRNSIGSAQKDNINGRVLSQAGDINSAMSKITESPFSGSMLDPFLQERLFQLRQEQELQRQLLLRQFQFQQQQLAEKHQEQLQHQIKEYLEHQKLRMEEQAKLENERREKEKLEALKNKDKGAQSAVASTEVKQILQEFVLRKKLEAASNSNLNGDSQNGPRNGRSYPMNSINHPYRNTLMGWKDDFPLRKTASEPNLKLRMKRSMLERRASPLVRNRENRMGSFIRRKSLLHMEANSPPSSGACSPLTVSPPVTGSDIPETESYSHESCTESLRRMVGDSHGSDERIPPLYTSPSLPNISLGRPPGSSIPAMVSHTHLSASCLRRSLCQENERLGVVMDTEPSSPTEAVSGLETSHNHNDYMSGDILEPPDPTEIPRVPIMPKLIQEKNFSICSRLNRTNHRPLSRTQSAPLPLGHPALHGSAVTAQQYQHELLRQHIRQTVLTRVNSKNLVDSAKKEAEELHGGGDEDVPPIIDLTDSPAMDSKKLDTTELLRQKLQRHQQHQQHREMLMRTMNQNTTGMPLPIKHHHQIRPLSRTLSSPLVSLNPSGNSQDSLQSPAPAPPNFKAPHATALVYDSLMLKHQCICGDAHAHPEHSSRLQSVFSRLQETGLLNRCLRLESRKATLEEIQTCHSELHALLFGLNPLTQSSLKLDLTRLTDFPLRNFVMLPCGGIGVDSDTTWNEHHTPSAARMAAGCVIELAFQVAAGEVKNGFALVRPPGHHAEYQQAMGFCFFNSIAIAAALLREKMSDKKILIFDWDVHHGNGTQQRFYTDRNVLYISIHRHDNGNFFPGTGAITEVGADEGVGFTVNIPWSGSLNPPIGDVEYLAAFRSVIFPVAKAFCPDMILVSAGFDAVIGHPAPLGGYHVTPSVFGYMTKQLMQLAEGKVALVLEGGYSLTAICDAVEECLKALLGDEVKELSQTALDSRPNTSACQVLEEVIDVQKQHWPCLKGNAKTVSWPFSKFLISEAEESDTISAMASLSVQNNHTCEQVNKSRVQEARLIETEEKDEPMEEDK